jgi:hypothetical protein
VSLGRKTSVAHAAIDKIDSRIVFLSFFTTFLLLALVVETSAQTRTVGVGVGNKFRYSVTISWTSDDPSATPPSALVDNNDTQWIEVNVTAISGTNITGQTTQQYKNGTEIIKDIWIDVNTGPSGNTMPYVISANLAPGDSAYTSYPFNTSWIINETVPRTYLGGVRDTNHLNVTISSGTESSPINMYWDKSTGVFEEFLQEVTNKTGEYTATALLDFRIISSNLWTLPEFPTWTPTLLVLIVLTLTIIVTTRQGKLRRPFR